MPKKKMAFADPADEFGYMCEPDRPWRPAKSDYIENEESDVEEEEEAERRTGVQAPATLVTRATKRQPPRNCKLGVTYREFAETESEGPFSDSGEESEDVDEAEPRSPHTAWPKRAKYPAKHQGRRPAVIMPTITAKGPPTFQVSPAPAAPQPLPATARLNISVVPVGTDPIVWVPRQWALSFAEATPPDGRHLPTIDPHDTLLLVPPYHVERAWLHASLVTELEMAHRRFVAGVSPNFKGNVFERGTYERLTWPEYLGATSKEMHGHYRTLVALFTTHARQTDRPPAPPLPHALPNFSLEHVRSAIMQRPDSTDLCRRLGIWPADEEEEEIPVGETKEESEKEPQAAAVGPPPRLQPKPRVPATAADADVYARGIISVESMQRVSDMLAHKSRPRVALQPRPTLRKYLKKKK